MKRVLFFAEAVTLAHVARPAVLAATLDADQYEVHLAQSPRYQHLLGNLQRWVHHEISSIRSAEFIEALSRGDRLYSAETLRSYVKEDLALIERVQPDVVVGDFRISLAVSAMTAGVPYITISNAYWSPYAVQRFIVPELPLVAAVGPRLAQRLFELVRPLAFYHHSQPMNKVRKEYGLPPVGNSVQNAYTWADYTLYADVPGMFDTRDMPDNHRFIGPILWSPADSTPAWWGDVPEGRPIVYVTMGSSGRAELLPAIIDVLGGMDVTGLVSTAGAAAPDNPHDNIFVSQFLPGEAVTSIASLVVCNGGSPTTHQALAEANPVIGIASNMDQFLNAQAIANTGAGVLMRGDAFSPALFRASILDMLHNTDYQHAALRIARQFAEYDSVSRFQSVLSELL